MIIVGCGAVFGLCGEPEMKFVLPINLSLTLLRPRSVRLE
jgi:hypothetical protein